MVFAAAPRATILIRIPVGRVFASEGIQSVSSSSPSAPAVCAGPRSPDAKLFARSEGADSARL